MNKIKDNISDIVTVSVSHHVQASVITRLYDEAKNRVEDILWRQIIAKTLRPVHIRVGVQVESEIMRHLGNK